MSDSIRKRLQFDFDEGAVARLDELVVEMGAVSRADVVRRALRLLDLVHKKTAAGAEMCFEQPNGSREIVLLP